ncbi:aspartyl/asparaginyl beta-hydroxylase [Photobacterium lutimaris]|nr:aspartyl/asparaginyl beta-hydroxylase [Photobacterium lutimaris]
MLSTKQQTIDLDKVDEAKWLSHVNKRCFDGEWCVLPLRGLAKYKISSPILQAFNFEESANSEEYDNFPILGSLPGIYQFLTSFPCSILSARLMKLNPGSMILPHTDNGLVLTNGQARLHYCLKTDPDVEFVVGGKRLKMSEGELWYINAAAEHAVYHRGHMPRIHLVFDCIVNDWLMAQLQPTTEYENR